MARSVDVKLQAPQSHGWNMITNSRESRANPTLADGVNPTATGGAGVSAASTAGVLGTGMNTDRTTPGIEAV